MACILYPRVDKGKSVENHHAHTQIGKTGGTRHPTKFSSLRHFEQMF